jgi:4-amino-4-deoxy-L-arabinose transferase-like glycosyltransferase
MQRNTGMVTLSHLWERFAPAFIGGGHDLEIPGYKKIPLDGYEDRDYGVAFEVPVGLLERLLQLDDSRDIFMFRHLVTFLIFVGGVFAVFRLAERRFSDWRIGLLAAFFLIISPRFFAESFYNSKDLVFMACFAIAMNGAVAFVLHPTIKLALLHALATAVAIDVRIMGVILPTVTFLALLFRLKRHELPWRTVLPAIAVYAGATVVLVVAFWPWLWSSPWHNFCEAFANMSRFRWDDTVLYMGDRIKATELPWHYIPVWIAISTPLAYLALFLSGVIDTVRQILERRSQLWRNDAELQDLIFLGLFVIPVLAVIVFHSTLYNGWRQMYFLYPAFLMVATKGWIILWRARADFIYKATLAVVLLFSLAYSAVWMARAHPFQYVYFNMLAGKDWKARFDMDYWGVSNRQALEYVLEHDSGPLVKIGGACDTPLKVSLFILKPEERSRIRVVFEATEADYTLTNYYYSQIGDVNDFTGYALFHQIKIGDEAISSTFYR